MTRMTIKEAIAELRLLQHEMDPEASYRAEDYCEAINIVVAELCRLRQAEKAAARSEKLS